MTTTTYPNGQTLTSTALTIQQINILVQTLTCGMLGINPVDPSAVRVDWQPQGQPDVATPDQDSCYISCVLQDTPYSRVRDRSYTGQDVATEVWVYTRGWRVAWEAYGPNSFDRMRQVHSALFLDYFNDQLSTLGNLYPVLDPAEPMRMPTNHNAQWYERSDFRIEMYEQVTETIQYPVVTSLEIKVYDGSPTDPVADVTITN